MSETFKFLLQNSMCHGVGWSRGLGDFLKENGYGRALILVDQGVADHSPYFWEIEGLLKAALTGLDVLVLRGSEEPDYDYLDQVAGQARALQKSDVLLGIGGGSCMDIAKAVAVLLTNPGKGIEYRGFHMVKVPGVPTVCIPTTAGTGSEVTINAVFTDKKEMKKLGINGRYLNATHAVLDAEWTMSCPPAVALSSGMDALTHAMESFMCKQHNGLTRVFSAAAFELLYKSLPSLVDDPQNRDKRQDILLGAYLAGVALFNSGSGISGALSYPIGVHFKVPHGIGGAVFLASVVEYNIKRGYTDYAELLDRIECNPGMSLAEKSKYFAELFRALSDKLGVPKYLDQWGITRANLKEVARLLIPFQGAFNQNPVEFSATEDGPKFLARHVKEGTSL